MGDNNGRFSRAEALHGPLFALRCSMTIRDVLLDILKKYISEFMEESGHPWSIEDDHLVIEFTESTMRLDLREINVYELDIMVYGGGY